MRLRSSAFADGGAIPRRFTCEGEDASPPLAWSEPPAGTRSFALLCDDPDAPSGTWHHWAAYDIPADRPGLPEGAGRSSARDLPQATNDFGRIGYGGPCPPRATVLITITFAYWRCQPTDCCWTKIRPAATWNERRASFSAPRRSWSVSISDDERRDPARVFVEFRVGDEVTRTLAKLARPLDRHGAQGHAGGAGATARLIQINVLALLEPQS